MITRSIKKIVYAERSFVCLGKILNVKNFQRTIKDFQRTSKERKNAQGAKFVYVMCKQGLSLSKTFLNIYVLNISTTVAVVLKT